MMTMDERLDLAMRVAAKSDQLIADSQDAKAEGRDNAALMLAGEAQGFINASRMILNASTDMKPLETVAQFAERVAIELGYWSEICRETAAHLETEGYPAAPAWAARDTYNKAARTVLTLAESAS